MGGDAGSHGSPDPGGWRGRQLPESQPRGQAPPKGQRPLWSALFPRGAHLAAFERAPRRCGTPGVREPPARPRRGNKARASQRVRAGSVSWEARTSRAAPMSLRGGSQPSLPAADRPQTARARTLFLTSAESP